MSLGARPPLYLPSLSTLGENQAGIMNKLRGVLVEKYFIGHTFYLYTQLSHMHCICGFSSRPKASSGIS